MFERHGRIGSRTICLALVRWRISVSVVGAQARRRLHGRRFRNVPRRRRDFRRLRDSVHARRRSPSRSGSRSCGPADLPRRRHPCQLERARFHGRARLGALAERDGARPERVGNGARLPSQRPLPDGLRALAVDEAGRSAVRKLGAGLLLVSGFGMAMLSFKTNHPESDATWHATIHVAAYFTFLVSLLLAYVVLTWGRGSGSTAHRGGMRRLRFFPGSGSSCFRKASRRVTTCFSRFSLRRC